MRTSLETLEATTPLDHNLEAVLPGLHSRMSVLQTEMAEGLRAVSTWQEQATTDHVSETKGWLKQSQSVAAQLCSIAATIAGWGNRGDGGDDSQALLLNSQQQVLNNIQQQAAAADDDDDDLGKARRHQLKKRHQSLYTIYHEWYGLEASEDQPIVGGYEKCDQLFKSSWRKKHTAAEKKHCSRMKMIILGLQTKAAMQGSEMEEVVGILDATCSKECEKSLAKMVAWMLSQKLIPERKKRATST